MMTPADLFSHACLAETLLDSIQKEIADHKENSPYSARTESLLRQAYRNASGLSASLNALEKMFDK